MAEEAGEKSQDATEHRRKQAREEGQVALSQDLSSATLLLGSLMILIYCGVAMSEQLATLVASHIGGEAWLRVDNGFLMTQWKNIMGNLAQVFLPAFGLMMLLGVLVNLGQIGFLLLPDKLSPDLSRLNPLPGFQRIFSLANFVKLGFGIIKIVIISVVAFVCLYNRRDEILSITALDLPQIAKYAWEINLWTCIKIGIALFILAILDYGFQKWKYEQDLKMTPQEVREEMKNMQGNPEVISRRKQVQRQLAMNRMSSAVPKADVVITNPTELAIAIQYEIETMAAPIVVAKGAGVMAQRIRRLALENNIPIIEKKPLAQALYKEVDLNHPIPDNMYAAVAEVLAYVYQLKGKPLPNQAK